MLRISKGVVLGALGALVLGAIASAALHTAEGTFDDRPMTIPAGREGDRLTYAYFGAGVGGVRYVNSSGSVSASTGGPVPGPTGSIESTGETRIEADDGPRLEGISIEALTTMLDRTGMVHDVALVVTGLDVSQNGAGGEIRQYVDLATRDPIRNDVHIESREGDMRLRAAEFGPGNLTLTGFVHGDLFAYQGHTFRLGDDLTDSDLGRERTRLFEAFEAEITTFSLSVDRRAVVDGRDSYGIVMHVRATVPTHSHQVSVRSDIGGSASETTTQARPTRADVEVKEVTWVSADVPYPVLIEREGRIVAEGDERTERTTVSLAAYEAGERPIPWGVDRAPVHYRERNDEAERHRAPYPADGTGSNLPYPLSSAVRSVIDDLTLAQFNLWRQTNPGNRLVGGQYSAATDEAGLTHLRWELFFAVPGDGFRVVSERTVGLPTERNSEDGRHTAPAFTSGDFPAEPITIAAAERLWTEVADQAYASGPPTLVRWGVTPHSTDPSSWNRIEIGHEASESSLGGFGFDSSVLAVEADTGNLMEFVEWALSSDRGLLTPAQPPSQNPAVHPKRVPAGIQPPRVEEAVAVSTSLLALFLTVYFWPLLKYAGVQGLLFVPGYAKLRKDAVLKNKVRGELIEIIKQDPGVHASELARRVDAGWGTIVYHLGVLEKNKYVTSLVDGRHKRFFPVGEIDWTKRGQVAVLRHPTARALFELVGEEPGIIQGALARRADLSVPSTIWHLKRLEDSGLVGREKRGRKVHYFANQGAPPRDAYDPTEAVEVA